MNRHGSRNAFTLIEVLVLIAILAILAAILVPVIARHRQRQSNLAEDPSPSRFTDTNELTRFAISMERTPMGMPDIYLVKDSKTTNEWLLLEMNGHTAISLIPK